MDEQVDNACYLIFLRKCYKLYANPLDSKIQPMVVAIRTVAHSQLDADLAND